ESGAPRPATARPWAVVWEPGGAAPGVAARTSPQESKMAVVVGFIPTDVGFKALDAAREEAELRGGPLIVVNVVRGGVADDPRHAGDGEVAVANDRPRGSMVRVEVRQLHTDDDIADVLLDVVDYEPAELLLLGVRRQTGLTVQKLLLSARSEVLVV